MKHKVAELEGAQLDAAVAQADGWRIAQVAGELEGRVLYVLAHSDRAAGVILADSEPFVGMPRYQPTRDWTQGGPIIERERIMLVPEYGAPWAAMVDAVIESGEITGSRVCQHGSTVLQAAMRAFVASKFADEVELP